MGAPLGLIESLDGQSRPSSPDQEPQRTGKTCPFLVVLPCGAIRKTVPLEGVFTVTPLTFPLRMVAPENVPLALKQTSQIWPFWIGLNCSQSGLVAVKLPEASGPEMMPFHPDPTIAALALSLKTIWNEV